MRPPSNSLEREGFLFQRPVDAEAAAARRLEAFVEDERRTAEALVTLPLTVFLLDRPWNCGPALPGLRRVRDWAEVLAHLTTVSGIVPL